MTLPPIRRTQVTSYGGDRVTCDLAVPRDDDELAELFAHCRAQGRTATLRCSGYAIDGQALNRDLIISLQRFTGLTIDRASQRARVGAAATWADITRSALAQGLIPPVIVTASGTSAGGTLASNSYSRFTPVRGKEIEHVDELELVTTRGERLRVSRDAHTDVFRGVVGGFGYLGATTRLTHRLDEGAPAAVATRMLGIAPVADLLAGLVPPFPRDGDAATTRYAVLLPALTRGFLYASHYLDHTPRWRPYRPVHQPRSLLRLIGEFALRVPGLARLIWWTHEQTVSRRPYIDPVVDFTFLMDGNVRANRVGRRAGLPMRALQQTFVMPIASGAAATAAAAAMIEAARDAFAARRLMPTFSDVLRLPADDAVLSSSRGVDGFAVSFAFETSSPPRLARIRDALRGLASTCGRLGGCVHLTKNVVADPADLAAMYRDAIPVFRRLKERLDPDFVLQNDFLRTNFPMLAAA